MVNSGSWLSIIFMSSKEIYVVQIGVVEPYLPAVPWLLHRYRGYGLMLCMHV